LLQEKEAWTRGTHMSQQVCPGERKISGLCKPVGDKTGLIRL